MIKAFKNKQLAALWAGKRSKIDARFKNRVLLRLDRLDVAETVKEMNLPSFDFHSLQGFNPKRYTVHVNGPWCITFEFDKGDAYTVDFEQYH
jgi:proteic killer suppression protein